MGWNRNGSQETSVWPQEQEGREVVSVKTWFHGGLGNKGHPMLPSRVRAGPGPKQDSG